MDILEKNIKMVIFICNISILAEILNLTLARISIYAGLWGF